MNDQLSLKDLERKAYISYHNDGLLDIFIGFVVICFALSIMFDFTAFAGIYSVLGITMMTLAKKRITVPRVGIVNFGSERRARMSREKRFFFFFFSATFLLGIMLFVALIADKGMVRGFMSTFILAPIGIIGSVTFSVLAYWKELRRYYVYALLILLSVFGGPLLGIEAPYYFMAGGIMILMPGLVVLVRFLKKYPLPDMEP